ncbi:MAG TPA: hypothetical protein VL652_34860 [Kutzneria sp.]|nr:hypothetical protein [Kutzneria sp.]
MSVWRLLLLLARHTACGRGRDEIYLVVHALPAPLANLADRANWRLEDLTFTDDRDRFVLLHAEHEMAR